MAKEQLNARVSDLTRRQLDELGKRWGTTQTETLTVIIDRMYRQEIKTTMKQIKVGTTNDLHLFAVEADGRYYPLSESDLNFEQPDAKIYYDSGIYPGVTLEELPQYICDKAKNR